MVRILQSKYFQCNVLLQQFLKLLPFKLKENSCYYLYLNSSSIDPKIFFHVEHNRPTVKMCQILSEYHTMLYSSYVLASSQIGDIAKTYGREY